MNLNICSLFRKPEILDCSCGGKGQLHKYVPPMKRWFNFLGKNRYYIVCDICGSQTALVETKKEAIRAWNDGEDE